MDEGKKKGRKEGKESAVVLSFREEMKKTTEAEIQKTPPNPPINHTLASRRLST